jgi:hypothetical protein
MANPVDSSATEYKDLVKEFDSKNDEYDQAKYVALLIDVVGSNKQLNGVSQEFKAEFKLSLMRFAKTTDAWIFASGVDSGVAKLVGDAVAEDEDCENVTTFGFIPFTNEDDYLHARRKLNPNFTHFVFINKSMWLGVDGGGFRSRFQRALVQYFNPSPMISLVVGGDLETLKTILLTLENNIPVILMAVFCSFHITISQKK